MVESMITMTVMKRYRYRSTDAHDKSGAHTGIQ